MESDNTLKCKNVVKAPETEDPSDDTSEESGKPKLSHRQEKFIIEYFNAGGVKIRAARAAEVPYQTVMNWFKDERFVTRITEIEGEWYEELRKEGLARAKSKSDVLLMFFLKARYPEIYDDNYRNKRFQDELIQKVKDSLAPIILEPQAKLDKPLV